MLSGRLKFVAEIIPGLNKKLEKLEKLVQQLPKNDEEYEKRYKESREILLKMYCEYANLIAEAMHNPGLLGIKTSVEYLERDPFAGRLGGFVHPACYYIIRKNKSNGQTVGEIYLHHWLSSGDPGYLSETLNNKARVFFEENHETFDYNDYNGILNYILNNMTRNKRED